MLQEISEPTPTTRKLKINIPADVIKAELDSSYNRLMTTVKIPGFRAGRVPYAILKKRFGKDVESEVIRKVVPEYYLKAIEEAKLEPVNYPDIDEKIELIPAQPLTFVVTVEVKPEIRELNYEGIELKEKTFSVEDEEVEKVLKSLQENKTLYSVTEDEIMEGDMAVINCETIVNGQPKEELSYKEYPFILGSGAMPKEFSDALIGKKKGETVEVKLSFEESHPNKTIAGKEFVYKVLITETKKKNLPPLDDDFAKEFDAGSMEEFRKRLQENIGKRKEGQINLEYKKEILNNLIKNHDFKVPDSMVERELEALVLEAKQNAMNRDEAIKSDEELRLEYRLTAEENVKGVIILEAIGKKENIEVDEDDVRLSMEEIGARNGLKPEEVMKIYMVREGSIDALKSRLFADKVLEFLLKKAVIK